MGHSGLLGGPVNLRYEEHPNGPFPIRRHVVRLQRHPPQAAKGEVHPIKTISPGEFLPTVESTLKEEGLLDKNVSELNLVGADSVQVQFTEVDFNLVLLWLIKLRQQYGISVQQLNATPAELPGIVNVGLRVVMTNQ